MNSTRFDKKQMDKSLKKDLLDLCVIELTISEEH